MSTPQSEKKEPEQKIQALPIITNQYIYTGKILSGKSKIAFYHEKKEYCIELVDGIFTAPDGEDWKDILLKSGFTVYQVVQHTPTEKQTAPEVVGDKEEIKKDPDDFYELIHPDWTERNDINANIKITIGKKEVAVKIEHGRVRTRFKSVYKRLLKDGYRPAKNYMESIENE